MNRNTVCLFVLSIASVIASAIASPYFHHIMNKRDKFCGRRLVDAVSVACSGHYNGPSPSKKSWNDILNYNEYNDQDDNEVTGAVSEFPYIPKAEAYQLIPEKWRRGIVDECCRNACSMNHMKMYCEK